MRLVIPLVVLILVLAYAVWWIRCLVHALKTPESIWAAAGQSRLVFVLALIFLGPLGPILYSLIARPALRRAGA